MAGFTSEFGKGSGVSPLLWPPGISKRQAIGDELLRDTSRLPPPYFSPPAGEMKKRGGQADRLISTGQLRTLLPLHLRPIDVVVFHEPEGNLFLERASRLDAFSAYPFRT